MLLIPRSYWTSWESNPGPFAYTEYAKRTLYQLSHTPYFRCFLVLEKLFACLGRA